MRFINFFIGLEYFHCSFNFLFQFFITRLKSFLLGFLQSSLLMDNFHTQWSLYVKKEAIIITWLLEQKLSKQRSHDNHYLKICLDWFDFYYNILSSFTSIKVLVLSHSIYWTHYCLCYRVSRAFIYQQEENFN